MKSKKWILKCGQIMEHLPFELKKWRGKRFHFEFSYVFIKFAKGFTNLWSFKWLTPRQGADKAKWITSDRRQDIAGIQPGELLAKNASRQGMRWKQLHVSPSWTLTRFSPNDSSSFHLNSRNPFSIVIGFLFIVHEIHMENHFPEIHVPTMRTYSSSRGWLVAQGLSHWIPKLQVGWVIVLIHAHHVWSHPKSSIYIYM